MMCPVFLVEKTTRCNDFFRFLMLSLFLCNIIYDYHTFLIRARLLLTGVVEGLAVAALPFLAWKTLPLATHSFDNGNIPSSTFHSRPKRISHLALLSSG